MAFFEHVSHHHEISRHTALPYYISEESLNSQQYDCAKKSELTPTSMCTEAGTGIHVLIPTLI